MSHATEMIRIWFLFSFRAKDDVKKKTFHTSEARTGRHVGTPGLLDGNDFHLLRIQKFKLRHAFMLSVP
jgi:hypothetical protein